MVKTSRENSSDLHVQEDSAYANHETRVADLIKRAETNLKTKGLVDKLFGGPDYKGAAELYTKAGKICRSMLSYYDAANCYENSGNCYLAIPDPRNAIADYKTATECYIKVGTTGSFGKAVELCKKIAVESDKLGKYVNAGNAMIDVANIYNEIDNEIELVSAYKTAIDYYEKDTTDVCMKKKVFDFKVDYAHLMFIIGKYMESAELLEKIAQEVNPTTISSENPYRFKVGKYLYIAGLYRLCEGNNIDFRMYETIYPIFNNTKHGTYLKDLLDICKTHNVEKFQTCMRDTDAIRDFEDWEVEIFLKIRDRIERELEEHEEQEDNRIL